MRSAALLLCLYLLTPTSVFADDVRARVALALAAKSPWTLRASTYSELRAQALKDSKPLCVWIGYKCPSSAVQVPGMIHYHAPGNTWNGIQGPAVVVAVPGGDGKLYQGEIVPAEKCCAVELRAAVERTLSRWEQAARPAPVMMAAPMPMMQQAPSFMRHVRGWASSRDGNCVG